MFIIFGNKRNILLRIGVPDAGDAMRTLPAPDNGMTYSVLRCNIRLSNALLTMRHEAHIRSKSVFSSTFIRP
jgi:hypothetical protein